MIDSLIIPIAAAAAVTAFIRIFPILCLAHRPFPPLLKYWLMFIPTAILTSIIASEVLHDRKECLFGLSVSVLAAFTSFIIAALWRNLFVAVVASIGSYLLFQYSHQFFHQFFYH